MQKWPPRTRWLKIFACSRNKRRVGGTKLMKRQISSFALCAGLILGAGCTAAVAAPEASNAKLWADVAHWPDFTTGMWALENPGAFDAKPGKKPAFTPGALPDGVELTPAAKAQFAAIRPGTEGSFSSCAPPGALGMRILPIAIFFAGDSIFFMTDMDDQLVRRVKMNRQDHDDPDPSWSGDSIGHWEGDTLVVDTTAIQPDIELTNNLPSGGNMHIVERLHLNNPDELEWDYTITDPGVLAKPWVITSKYNRRKTWELQVAACATGNRDSDAAYVNGAPVVDLAPKK
jgi:hypothetical protein